MVYAGVIIPAVGLTYGQIALFVALIAVFFVFFRIGGPPDD